MSKRGVKSNNRINKNNKLLNNENNKLLNERGQAESVFRLMIDSAIGLAILLIIISALSYFQQVAIQQSMADFMFLMDSATSSPDGQVIISKDLTFEQGIIIDAADLQNRTGVSKYCFNFAAELGSVTPSEDQKQVTFSRRISLKVYAKCTPSDDAKNCQTRIAPENENECCFKCLVSFGKISD
ncbi:MAG: hypothetical protein NTY48_00865 [Candidatus Diapherotrites archaeon]|nr:hypothetical protein [Candidatus Diapherotrites archaeon]